MALAQSKLTAQGQISVPAPIRRKLGLAPGSVIQWEERDGEVVVRKAGSYTFEDAHRVLFPEGPPKRRTLKELREGIGEYIEERYGHKR